MPAWLLLAPRVRPRAVVGSLAVVAGAYWLLGLTLLLGADAILSVVDDAGGAKRPVPMLVAQLVVGVLLLVWAVLPKRWRRLKRGTHSGVSPDGPINQRDRPGLLTRWRDKVAEGETSWGLLALAAIAVLLEAATMLPYLGAVTMLAAAGLPDGVPALVLAGYCAVMIAPALLLVLARTIAAQRVEPLLQRLDQWSRREGGEVLLWIAGVAGFLLAFSDRALPYDGTHGNAGVRRQGQPGRARGHPRLGSRRFGRRTGDRVRFVVEDGHVKLFTATSLLNDVWANNHGGDAGDSVADVRRSRRADTLRSNAKWARVADQAQADTRSEVEIERGLLDQLGLPDDRA